MTASICLSLRRAGGGCADGACLRPAAGLHPRVLRPHQQVGGGDRDNSSLVGRVHTQRVERQQPRANALKAELWVRRGVVQVFHPVRCLCVAGMTACTNICGRPTAGSPSGEEALFRPHSSTLSPCPRTCSHGNIVQVDVAGFLTGPTWSCNGYVCSCESVSLSSCDFSCEANLVSVVLVLLAGCSYLVRPSRAWWGPTS